MANIGLEHLMFLFTFHLVLTFGAEADLIGETQVGQSEKFVENVENGQLQEATDPGDTEGITDQIGITIKSIPIIGEIYNLFTTPYGLIINSTMPGFIKTLITGLFGIIEISVIAGYIRGVDL